MSIKSGLKGLNKRFLPQHLFYEPQWLVLGVNNICNLHCKMCDVGTNNLETNFAENLVGTRPLHMPLELFQLIVDQSVKFFPNIKLGYAFTEPLVYKYLGESLKYAFENKMYTSITTNGLNLRQKAEDINAFRVSDLFLSLDGPQDIHNEIRGHKSSFQRAIEGIEELIKLNSKTKISIYCVITEWNIGYLKQFADFFSKYPLERLGFMHTNFTPKHIADSHNRLFNDKYPATHSNVEEVNIDNMDLKLLWEEIKSIKNKKYHFPVIFSPEITNEEQLNTFYKKPEILIGKKCEDVFSNIMIKSDGSVIPSHGRCYNLKIGNLYETNLKEIWNAPTLSRFRQDLNKTGGLMPACSRCCSAF